MWFIIPGGQVTDVVADRIKQHPTVVGQKDGLFPHHDQTWRMQKCLNPRKGGRASTRLSKQTP